ncbi:MAG: alpha/beta hydrolase [Phycisphaeraceae bacterium]|nr:alpha/beta hydrolase [Phycisphaeraceae bacterium]MBX3366075.1 alpha/beta hydrolase [Phycisphaeraceae bacterium]QYK48574.1 MAG: alpha/beta hydrolase [Phycisphaeraceae bacterium]
MSTGSDQLGFAISDFKVGSRVLYGPEGTPIEAKVEQAGTGRRVVFLHGLVGLNDHWEDVVRSIRHRAACEMLEIPLLSLRGEDCTIHAVTEMTIRYLSSNPEPSILVGNSFGGHVALRVAIERPDLVAGLVLAGASGLLERTMVREIQIRPSREWLGEKIGELFHDRSKMREADLDRAHQELSVRGGARAMVRLSRTARRNHLGPKISQISCPTLLIWGRQDIVTPPEAAEEFHAKIPDTRLVWLEQCGHAPMIECPAEFATAMNGFLDEFDRRENGT